jgi:hypothetical protein
MPRNLLSGSSRLTNRDQGGGSKKGGLAPTATASTTRFRAMYSRAGYSLEDYQEDAGSNSSDPDPAPAPAPAPATDPLSQITQTLIRDPDSTSRDSFGWSVSISGKRAIVGACNTSEEGLNNAGSAYIYEYDEASGNWNFTKKLVTPNMNSQVNGKFGVSVSIDGDYAVVGESGHSDNNGAAYIFNTDTWENVYTMYRPNGDNANYGKSVDICGDYAIVGSLKADGTGKVDIFTRAGDEQGSFPSWSFYQLVSPESGDRYGESVAISENYAIVGAYFGKKAYIYKKDGSDWNLLHTLTNSNSSDSTTYGFGIAVSITDKHAVVSDLTETDTTGVVYVYDLTANPLAAPQRLTKDYTNFGQSVNLSGNYLIVGAPFSSDTANNNATIYKLDEGTGEWTEHSSFDKTGTEAYRFGYSVAITDDHAVVGAPGRWNSNGAAFMI